MLETPGLAIILLKETASHLRLFMQLDMWNWAAAFLLTYHIYYLTSGNFQFHADG